MITKNKTKLTKKKKRGILEVDARNFSSVIQSMRHQGKRGFKPEEERQFGVQYF